MWWIALVMLLVALIALACCPDVRLVFFGRLKKNDYKAPPTHTAQRGGGGDCRVLTTAESVVSVAGPHAIITACKQRLNMQICHYYIIEV